MIYVEEKSFCLIKWVFPSEGTQRPILCSNVAILFVHIRVKIVMDIKKIDALQKLRVIGKSTIQMLYIIIQRWINTEIKIFKNDENDICGRYQCSL